MKKLKILLLFFIFVIMLFFLTDIYLVILGPLDNGISLEKIDAEIILVLGGGLKTLKEIGLSTSERLELAAEIYRRKEVPIVVSDGSLYKKSPAIKMVKDFLAERGVKEKHIIFEGKSQTTFDNFVFTENIIRKYDPDTVVVCTSPYHQFRSGSIIRSLKLKNYKVVRMKESEIYRTGTIKQRLRNLKLVFREYFAIVKFKLIVR